MELTLESAFSMGGLVGHLSYLLLVVSMIMRIMWLLRIFVIASSIVAITYDVIWLKDPVGVFWESLLVLVNLVQLGITYVENLRTQFSREESDFVNACFPGLSRKCKRRLLDLGRWTESGENVRLTEDGMPVSYLYYLVSGEVDIVSNGKVVGVCKAGRFVGEMTAMSGAPANGTAVVAKPARYWAIPVGDLRRLASRSEEIDQALQACFQRTLMLKLIDSNKLIENSGGLHSPATA